MIDLTPPAARQRLARDYNLLLLCARPAEAIADPLGLIALGCRLGRQPFVAVIADGSSEDAVGLADTHRRAMAWERTTRAAAAAAGLATDRLLFVGVHDRAVPTDGEFFEAIVAAVGFLAWARDCTAICGPRLDAAEADRAATGTIGQEAARRAAIPFATLV